MNQSNFIRQLNVLQNEDLKQFKQFVESPFHNRKKPEIQLFEVLYFYLKNGKALDENRVHKRAFPDRDFDRNYLNTRLSYLHKLFKKFLVTQRILNDENRFNEELRHIYRAQNDDENFRKMSTLCQPPAQSFLWEDHQKGINFYHDLYTYPTLNKDFRDAAYPQKILNHLDEHFITLKLHYALDIFSRKNTFQEDYEIKLLNEVINFVSNQKNPNLLHQIYLKLIQLHRQGFDFDNYQKAKEKFSEIYQKLPASVQTNLVSQFYNFCGNLHAQGDERMTLECFFWDKFRIENDLLIVNNQLSETAYLNIVAIGVASRQLDYVENFIKSYTKFLNEKLQNFNHQLANTYLLFYRNKLEETQQILTQLTDLTIGDKFRIKSLSIRCLFKSFQQDSSCKKSLTDGMAAFRKFMKRDEGFSEHRKNAYFNFLHFVAELINLHESADYNQLEKVKIALRASSPVALKSWLFREIRLMEKQED